MCLLHLPQVRVQQSQAKHKLFIGGIPREMQQAALEEALRGAVKGGGWQGCRGQAEEGGRREGRRREGERLQRGGPRRVRVHRS